VESRANSYYFVDIQIEYEILHIKERKIEVDCVCMHHRCGIVSKLSVSLLIFHPAQKPKLYSNPPTVPVNYRKSAIMYLGPLGNNRKLSYQRRWMLPAHKYIDECSFIGG